MRAHADDLRAEVAKSASADERQLDVDALLTHPAVPWGQPRHQALIAFAIRLTREPQAMSQSDTDALRATGLDDAAIHDAVQAIALFNYYNRLADGWASIPSPSGPSLAPGEPSSGSADESW